MRRSEGTQEFEFEAAAPNIGPIVRRKPSQCVFAEAWLRRFE